MEGREESLIFFYDLKKEKYSLTLFFIIDAKILSWMVDWKIEGRFNIFFFLKKKILIKILLTFFADAGLGLKSDWEVSLIEGGKILLIFFWFKKKTYTYLYFIDAGVLSWIEYLLCKAKVLDCHRSLDWKGNRRWAIFIILFIFLKKFKIRKKNNYYLSLCRSRNPGLSKPPKP